MQRRWVRESEGEILSNLVQLVTKVTPLLSYDTDDLIRRTLDIFECLYRTWIYISHRNILIDIDWFVCIHQCLCLKMLLDIWILCLAIEFSWVGFGWGTGNWEGTSTYFLPWMTLNLWEFEFRIVWIHFAYLFSCRCAQNFDHFNQLINARVTRKDWLSQQQFS